MQRLIDLYCRFLDGVIALLLAIMVVLVFGNVVLRYAFNSGITVSEEMSRWAFVWLTFLGAIVALKEHHHLGSDMLVSRLGVTGKKVCLLIGQALMLYITWLILSGSWQQAKINWDVEAPVTGASVALFYGAGIVFAVSAGLLLMREMYRALTGQLSEKDLVMVTESEEAAELEALQEELEKDSGSVPDNINTRKPNGPPDGNPPASRPQGGKP
jgi:TRAP-type transport system small permease protein